ncbi:MAG: type IIL restriction-modification enzyme MmeI, partial [Syntrophus sp. (in: bacteria)]
REVGLEQIAERGGCIYRAVSSRPWPGDASLEVAHVWQQAGEWEGDYHLDDETVSGVSPFLTIPGKIVGKPFRLAANTDKSFQGSIVLGMGFVLTEKEAKELIAENPKNAECLFPYLNGEDLNTRPDQSPSRWVINFRNWPLNRTAEGCWLAADEAKRKTWLREGIVPRDYSEPVVVDYPDLLAIIEEKVKPERQKLKDDGGIQSRRKKFWWQYGASAPTLYATISEMEKVLVIARTSRTLAFAFMKSRTIFSDATNVIASGDARYFAILQSVFHESWARDYSSSLKGDLRYSPSDCFENFTFPKSMDTLENIGEVYYEHRYNIMQHHQEGLTQTYNRFHNINETSEDISHLRGLHMEMDNAVATAYGWTNLDLCHGFHKTKHGIRFTISEQARRIILDLLLALNHERYEEEVKAGLHDKKTAKGSGKGRKKKSPPDKKEDQYEIFEE